MGGEHGVDQLVLGLEVLAEGGNVAEKMAKKDQSLGSRLGHLLLLSDELIALSGLDGKEFKAQAMELDAADRAKLVLKFQEKFDLENDIAEKAIEQGLILLVRGTELVVDSIEFAKALRAGKE